MDLTAEAAKVGGTTGRRLAPPATQEKEVPMAAVYSDLAGKVVLVTGGASGIGAAIVRRFAQQKSNVVFFDIKADEGQRLARELSDQGLAAHFQRVDLTDIAALRELKAQLEQQAATLAAQRASKILGIFARLERRDHKPQYLRHMPRVWNYLQRSLAHPGLAPLAAWYRANVPALKV